MSLLPEALPGGVPKEPCIASPKKCTRNRRFTPWNKRDLPHGIGEMGIFHGMKVMVSLHTSM